MTRIASALARATRTAPPTRAAWLLAIGTAFALCPPATDLAAQRAYPAASHGGNYMHNFYFPPAPSSSPWYPEPGIPAASASRWR